MRCREIHYIWYIAKLQSHRPTMKKLGGNEELRIAAWHFSGYKFAFGLNSHHASLWYNQLIVAMTKAIGMLARKLKRAQKRFLKH